MVNVTDDLERDLRKHMLARMVPDPNGELAQLPLNSLLIRWFNWRDRFVMIRPRRVHISKELGSSHQAVEHRVPLRVIRSEVTNGDDLSLRLSRRIRYPVSSKAASAALGSRVDLDLLLADWGIHHLHLSPTNDGARTGELLFSILRPDDAYFISIGDHNSWNDEELIRIVVRNWPSANLVLGSYTGVSTRVPPSSLERKALRRVGMGLPVDVDGSLYIARGLTLGGVAIDVTRKSNKIMHGLRHIRELIDEDANALTTIATNQQCGIDPSPVWNSYVTQVDFGFEESKSGSRLKLGDL